MAYLPLLKTYGVSISTYPMPGKAVRSGILIPALVYQSSGLGIQNPTLVYSVTSVTTIVGLDSFLSNQPWRKGNE